MSLVPGTLLEAQSNNPVYPGTRYHTGPRSCCSRVPVEDTVLPPSENSCIDYRNPHCQEAYFSTDYVDYIAIFYVRVGLLENMRFFVLHRHEH